MNVKELIERLKKEDLEAEVYYSCGCGNASIISGIFNGFYCDNDFDAPEIIVCSDDEKYLYDIPDDQNKVVGIE